MKYKYKITFISKQFLAFAILEIHLWQASHRKFSVISNDEHCILTSDNNIIDVITEAFKKDEYHITDNVE